jgi:hypothetical protein
MQELSTTKPKATLTLDDRKRVVVDFYNGISKNKIAKTYNLSPSTVNSIVSNKGDKVRAQAQEDIRDAHIAFENATIRDLKRTVFKYAKDAYKASDPNSAEPDQRFIHYIDKTTKFLKTIDEMERLNDNRATSITHSETTTKTYNIADLMKELKTPQDAKDYLLSQLEEQEQAQNQS